MESSGHDTGSRASSRRSGPTSNIDSRRGRGSTSDIASPNNKPQREASGPRGSQRATNVKPNSQGEGLGNQVTQSPSFPLVNLKDVMSASRTAKGTPPVPPGGKSRQSRDGGGGGAGGSRPQTLFQDGRESTSSKTSVRRERPDHRRQGASTRGTSDNPSSNTTTRTSQHSSDRGKSSARTQTATSSSSEGDTQSRHKTANHSSKTSSNSNSNSRSKNSAKSSTESQDAKAKNGRNPGRLKKSTSMGGEAGGKDKDMFGQLQISSAKSTPRAKKKISRGRTVHDANEFGDVKEKQANDVSRTLRQASPVRDIINSHKERANNVQRKPTAAEMNQRTSPSAVQELTSAPYLSQPLSPTSPPPPASKASAFHVQLVPELSQQSSFFSLNKVPSRSSTSSDVQSEVCVDLPDYSELSAAQDAVNPHTDRLEGGSDRKLTVSFPTAPYRRLSGVGRRRQSLCLATLGTVVVLVFSLLLFLPVLVLVLVLVPLCLFLKWLCSLCCCCGPLWGRCCIGCCHTHLTAPERLWVQKGEVGGGSGRFNPVAQCIIVLQRGLSTERLRHLLDARLLSLENRHGRLVYPRFTQRVEEFCCGYAWVSDHHFVLNNHVFNMPGYIESLEDLQDHIAKMASEPLPVDRPLWEIQVLHNFREPRDTVLLVRLHLALADGASVVRLLQQALVDTQKMTPPKAGFGVEAANMSPLKAFFLGPITFFRRYLFMKGDFNLLHGPHVHPCGEMAVAWSEPFSLSAAVRVKQVARCTLSELLVSVVAGNMRTYMQVSGVQNPYNIHCALPVDFRSDYSPSPTGSPGVVTPSTEIGNHYSMAVLPLASNTEGAIPRLWETKQRLEQFKTSPEAAIVSGAQWFTCCVLPVRLFQRLWQRIYSRCTLLVANLAGPEVSLKLDSREIKCMMYWVPPLHRVAITVSFLTYADQVRMAVICDRSVLPNPELLTRDFIYKLETVSKLLAHRRIPGEQLNHRMESMNLLSSYTLDDLTAEQIQLQMALVQQELHDMKRQLDQGPSHRLTANDTQLCQRIEQLKERFRELLMHLRKRRAAEAENAIILSEEDELFDSDSDRPGGRPFRRRTLSISSRLSTASVSSQMRPLSTASVSNQPSPSHAAFSPTWPDSGSSDMDRLLGSTGSSSNGGTSGPGSKKHGYNYRQRLSTMEEFEVDESLIVTTEGRRYNTY